MDTYKHKKEMEIPIYRGMFGVIVSNDSEWVREELKGTDLGPLYAHCLIQDINEYEYVICVFNFDGIRNITHGVVSHEAYHAVSMLFNERGISPSFKNDEAMAYMIEWFTDRIYEFLDEINFKIK